MEKTKAKWVKWGVDEKTIANWIEFKDEPYLVAITADTEVRAKFNPGALLRKRIKEGDTVRTPETIKPYHEVKIKIYSRSENIRWWKSLTWEEIEEAYDYASWKFPPLAVHMSSAGRSHLDDDICGHWLFEMMMEVLDRPEREPFVLVDADKPRMKPAFLHR